MEGNEEADKLARKGAEAPFWGPEPFCGVGIHKIREELKKEEEAKRSKHWRDCPGLRQAKELLGNYNRKRYEAVIKLNKNRLRILTGLLTGHCKLREHLRKLGLEAEGTCRFCHDAEETPMHLLRDCGALLCKRRDYLGAYSLNNDQLQSVEPVKILEFAISAGLEEVL